MLNAVTYNSLMSYLLPVVCCAAAFVLSVVLGVTVFKMIKRQIKLYNSIRLVELKSGKIRYLAFILVVGFAIFYLGSQIFDPMAPEYELMAGLFDMQKWQYNLTLSSVIWILIFVGLFLAALAISKSAVVDKGIYTEFGYLDWYHVHDYIIDEDKGRVILSGNKYTFQTLKDTTSPLKVAKNDVEKLKFILNKNKNKFSGFEKQSL